MKSFLMTFLVGIQLGGVDSFVIQQPTSSSILGVSHPSQQMAYDNSSPSLSAMVLPNESNDESIYHTTIKKAKEYAFSETTTVQEAKIYLQRILELQSACVIGTAIGSDICDNVIEISDIVAHLRQKVQQNHAMMGSSQNAAVVTTIGSIIALTMIIAGTKIPSNPDIVPFTWEEWRWALQGGYLDTMIAHYIRHGGL